MKNLQALIYTGSFFNVAVSVTLPKENKHINLKFDGMPISTTNFNVVTNPKSFVEACDACINMLGKLQCQSKFPHTTATDHSANDDFRRVITLLVDYVEKIKDMSGWNQNIPQMKVETIFPTEIDIFVGVSITPSCDSTLFTFEHSSGIG